MSVELRPMRWWDITAVTEIEERLFVDDAWSAAMFWSELAQRDTRCYVVAVRDDRVIGYVGLCAYPPHEAYVQTIAVDVDAQHQGVGRQLLTLVIDEAQRRECRHVDLEVRADNAVAIALYEQFDFAPIGMRRGYYQPSGADALVMRREVAS